MEAEPEPLDFNRLRELIADSPISRAWIDIHRQLWELRQVRALTHEQIGHVEETLRDVRVRWMKELADDDSKLSNEDFADMLLATSMGDGMILELIALGVVE